MTPNEIRLVAVFGIIVIAGFAVAFARALDVAIRAARHARAGMRRDGLSVLSARAARPLERRDVVVGRQRC